MATGYDSGFARLFEGVDRRDLSDSSLIYHNASSNGNGHGHVPPNQLEAKIYRHEAPSSNETYELPVAPKLSELSSSDTLTAELPVPNQDLRPGTQTR